MDKDVVICVQAAVKTGVIKCGKLLVDKSKNWTKESKEWFKDSDLKCLHYNLNKVFNQLKKINDPSFILIL